MKPPGVPLTPTLSPSDGEREQQRLAGLSSWALRLVHGWPTLLPLPIGWGEGWGEGKLDEQTQGTVPELVCAGPRRSAHSTLDP